MNPNYHDQVKIKEGPTHNGAWARAVDVAVNLFKSGRWDGQGTLFVRDAYEVHYKMAGVAGSLDALVEGEDYWIEA
jgi:hypothetical protein